MSISDELMWRYYLLLTDMTPGEIEVLKKSVVAGKVHPLDAKKRLSRRIVADFHGGPAAAQAQRDFEAQFQFGTLPSEILEIFHPIDSSERLSRVLAATGIAPSGSVAQRKIKEGAVELSFEEGPKPSWERITDPTWQLDPNKHDIVTVRYGKKLSKVRLRRKK